MKLAILLVLLFSLLLPGCMTGRCTSTGYDPKRDRTIHCERRWHSGFHLWREKVWTDTKPRLVPFDDLTYKPGKVPPEHKY